MPGRVRKWKPTGEYNRSGAIPKFSDYSPRFYLCALLLIITYIFGGQSNEVSVHVYGTATCLIGLAWLFFSNRKRDERTLDPWLLVIGLLPILIHAVQIIPLPPSIWHALPGREVEIKSLTLVGMQNSWMPISIDPYATQLGIFQNIPAAAMLYMVLRLSDRDRSGLLIVVVALGLVAALVGTAQVSGGSSNFMRFYQYTFNSPWVTGFNANRNTTAELFNYSAIALCCAASVYSKATTPRRLAAILILGVFIFFISTIMTGSRSGMIASIVPMTFAAILIFRQNFKLTRKSMLIIGGAAILALSAVGMLSSNTRVQSSWKRFEATFDVSRVHIYEDTQYAIGQYWPVGSGMNSFDTVFPSAERLEYVSFKYANRAHNEYLELALESGIAGLTLFAAIFIIVAYKIIYILFKKRDTPSANYAIFATLVLTLSALHSLVDYPLRTVAVSVIAWLAIALLSTRPMRAAAPDTGQHS